MLLLWRGHQHPILATADDWFLNVRKKRAERIKIARRERIELVIVTLCTAGRETQPYSPDRADPVRQHAGFIILRLCATLSRSEQQPIKRRTNPRFLRGIRQ